jgi:UDP-N-acetylmuramyl pentapeptide phosphotransferase/UDP-N-acetylglucosamine-1-phosphate transferase
MHILILALISALIVNASILFFSSSILRKYVYEASHAIHAGNIPRLGGISIYLALVITSFTTFSSSISSFLLKLSISILPIFCLSIIEDLKHNINPSYRFIASLGSSVLILYFFGTIKNIDFPYLYSVIHSDIFLAVLTVLAISSITQSFNIIDGLNGLATFSYWAILSSIYYLSIQFQDTLFQNLIFTLAILPLGFFFFNFPQGKIFLGDTGAYILGFMVSVLTIHFFNKNPNIFSWQAILILIYPVTEIIFTFFRRLAINISPTIADSMHLHFLLYKVVSKKKISKKAANNVSTILMLPFVFAGPLAAIFFVTNIFSIFLLIFLYILSYLAFYRFLKNSILYNKIV